MLRKAVLVFACLCVLSGLWLATRGLAAPAAYSVVLGVLILLGTVFERWRYRKPERTAGAGWQTTGERFVDPATGKDIEVFYDPVSGERRYVEH